MTVPAAERYTVAVVLAAGTSQRMGECNKLTLPIFNSTLLRHGVQQLIASVVDKVIVVTGHQADAISHSLNGLPVRTIHNLHYSRGLASSALRGLEAVPDTATGIIMSLGDQPLLTAADIDQSVDAFYRSGMAALVPYHNGQRGNPAIVSGACRQLILRDFPDTAVRGFIDAHPDRVSRWETPNRHWVTDVDTPGDYQRLTSKPAP